MRLRILAILALLASLLSGCGYNTFQTGDEAIKSAWSEVLNQYQRRADLVPNLVATVQGYASHEKEVLTQVTQARAQVGSIQATPELIAAWARSLARALMVNEDLAEAVALSHDLGHTPFAHTGEDVLKECMKPYGGFEHNDQSLRVLTKPTKITTTVETSVSRLPI